MSLVRFLKGGKVFRHGIFIMRGEGVSKAAIARRIVTRTALTGEFFLEVDVHIPLGRNGLKWSCILWLASTWGKGGGCFSYPLFPHPRKEANYMWMNSELGIWMIPFIILRAGHKSVWNIIEYVNEIYISFISSNDTRSFYLTSLSFNTAVSWR